MINSRQAARTNSSETCALQLGAAHYQCRLDNVSSGGAQINSIGLLRDVRPGDAGVLLLAGRPEGVSCHVMHIAAAKIGLQFDQ